MFEKRSEDILYDREEFTIAEKLYEEYMKMTKTLNNLENINIMLKTIMLGSKISNKVF